MFKGLIRFFKGPTPAEAYENGKQVARRALQAALDKNEEAEHLLAMASGGFNTKEVHRAFDRGVQDEVSRQGYLDHTEELSEAELKLWEEFNGGPPSRKQWKV